MTYAHCEPVGSLPCGRRCAALWLTEAASADAAEIPEAILQSGLPVLRIHTKADRLPEGAEPPRDGITVSTVTGQGIDRLKEHLRKLFADLPDTPLTQQRHIIAAREAAAALHEAAGALDDHLSQEFAAVHLHAALDTLGAITGEQTDERLLDEIFSNFCVGK